MLIFTLNVISSLAVVRVTTHFKIDYLQVKIRYQNNTSNLEKS